jgi:hypothetical protein
VCTQLTDPEQFPDHWYGYQGLSSLVVTTSLSSVLEQLDATQFGALVSWVRLGGRMVISASRRAEELFAPTGRFHVFRPGTFVESDTYWKASGLENFARAGDPVDPDQLGPLAVFTQLRGRTLCLEGAGGAQDRALVVQYPVGFGDVTFLALDLEELPLSSWSARPRLLARLLQPNDEGGDSSSGGQRMGQVTHLGFDDLTGQLRAALEQFPDVTLVQFSWVAVLLVGYVLLIGPLDFLLLRRWGRPQWTWITFPLLVVLFSALAMWLSQHWKGSTLQVNQVEVVDIDIPDQLMRGTTWANLYSPRATTLQLRVEPSGDDPSTSESPVEVLASWQGLPGSGMGGMSNPTGVNALGDQYDSAEYQVTYPLSSPMPLDQAQIDALPLQTASTKGLVAIWSRPVNLGPSSELVADDLNLLEGKVTNPLDVELTNCSIYFHNWAYPLDGPLAPGGSARLGNAQPLDLRWRLTRRSVVGTREVRSTWRRDDLSDVNRILEMLMFHNAAGGRLYTNLSHNYQKSVDLSRHLRIGRAILVGRCATPQSRLAIQPGGSETGDASDQNIWQLDDTNHQHWTYYRIVLPVAEATADPQD